MLPKYETTDDTLLKALKKLEETIPKLSEQEKEEVKEVK